MFEGMPKKAESVDNTNAPIESGTEKEGLEEVIAEARSISAELVEFKKEGNGYEVVVDLRTYKRIQKQQQRLYELFMGNPELTRVVCKRKGILYDPRLDEMRKTANDNPVPLEVVN